MSWDKYDPDKMPASIITVKGKGFEFVCKDNREALTLFLIHYINREEYYEHSHQVGRFMGMNTLSRDHILPCSGIPYIDWLNNCHPYDYVQEFMCDVEHPDIEELSFEVLLLCPDCKVELEQCSVPAKLKGCHLEYQQCPRCYWNNKNTSDDAVMVHDSNAIISHEQKGE